MSPTVGLLATLLATPPSVAPTRTAVVVELFSSEGCSSCPDADAVLRELDRDQPVRGAQVVALELHVDYWNRLGWADPFSKADYSERQGRYASVLADSGPYTPQMIVDGSAQFVGSRASTARDTIAAAAARPHPARIGLAQTGARVAIDLVDGDPGADVVEAITETGLSSEVTRGENAGLTLAHGPVVRELRKLGSVGADGHFAGSLDLSPAHQGEHHRAVVFLQDPRSLHIHGAAVLELAR